MANSELSELQKNGKVLRGNNFVNDIMQQNFQKTLMESGGGGWGDMD